MKTMRMRRFADGDEAALLEVFRSSVHGLAARDYTPEQLDAWAPQDVSASYPVQWARRMQMLRPWVVEIDGRIVAYADLQSSGHIDHCFVAAAFARHGVGSALMRHLHRVAQADGIRVLWADVSVSARPFFLHAGFVVEREQEVSVCGVMLRNARMHKTLSPAGGPAPMPGT